MTLRWQCVSPNAARLNARMFSGLRVQAASAHRERVAVCARSFPAATPISDRSQSSRSLEARPAPALDRFALGAMAFVLAFFHRLRAGAIAASCSSLATSSASLGLLARPISTCTSPCRYLRASSPTRRGRVRYSLPAALVAVAGSVLFGLAPDFGIAVFRPLPRGLGVSVASSPC